MSGLTFIVQMTQALAWPVSALIFIFIFRGQIAHAFGHVTNIKLPGGAEASFDRGLNSAAEQAKAIEQAPREIAALNDVRLAELVDMSATSPTGAIIEAWKDVEQAARNLAERSGKPMSSSELGRMFNLESFLVRNELLPNAEIETFRNLRALRNRAAHDNESKVSATSARKYVRIADQLVDTIESLTS